MYERLPKLVIFSHFSLIASGVSALLTENPCPPASCHRTCAAHPPETSNNPPVVSLSSLVKYPTTGATKSGLNASTISLGQTVMVMAVPAEGAMALARMPYLAPSMARVRVRPMMAALAVV